MLGVLQVETQAGQRSKRVKMGGKIHNEEKTLDRYEALEILRRASGVIASRPFGNDFQPAMLYKADIQYNVCISIF
jgi:hypothetical protein